MHRRSSRAMAAVAVALAIGAATVASPARAQDKPAEKPAAEERPNTGRVSVSIGADWATDYYFRGIVQETQDDIVQPYGSLSLRLWEGESGLTGVTVTVGTWNSLHWGPTGLGGGAGASDPKGWYEADVYATLAVELFKSLTFTTTWTAYTSPNNVFETVQEVAFGLALADAEWLGPFALNPYVLVAAETSGQADAGRHRGVYMEVGVTPGFGLFADGPVPLNVSFPVKVGLSLSDYYEFGTGHDSTFGFASGGIALAVPLTFVPKPFGAWEARSSVTFLGLGHQLRKLNDGDRFEVIGTFGLAMKY